MMMVYTPLKGHSMYIDVSAMTVNGKEILFGYTDIDGEHRNFSIDCKSAKKAKCFYEEIIKQTTIGDTACYNEVANDLYFIKKEPQTVAQREVRDSFEEVFEKFFGSK